MVQAFKQSSPLTQAWWLFISSTFVFILLSGSLWLQENTLLAIFWDNSLPFDISIQNIRVWTLFELVLFALLIALFFFAVKSLIMIWNPEESIYRIGRHTAYICILLFFFLLDSMNGLKYSRGGFHDFKIFDAIGPLCIAITVFMISVPIYYLATEHKKEEEL